MINRPRLARACQQGESDLAIQRGHTGDVTSSLKFRLPSLDDGAEAGAATRIALTSTFGLSGSCARTCVAVSHLDSRPPQHARACTGAHTWWHGSRRGEAGEAGETGELGERAHLLERGARLSCTALAQEDLQRLDDSQLALQSVRHLCHAPHFQSHLPADPDPS
jgi:hypothetical protein